MQGGLSHMLTMNIMLTMQLVWFGPVLSGLVRIWLEAWPDLFLLTYVRTLVGPGMVKSGLIFSRRIWYGVVWSGMVGSGIVWTVRTGRARQQN